MNDNWRCSSSFTSFLENLLEEIAIKALRDESLDVHFNWLLKLARLVYRSLPQRSEAKKRGKYLS
jgi:hypothetical protein